MLNWQNIYIKKRANSRFLKAKFVSVVVIESVSFISVNLSKNRCSITCLPFVIRCCPLYRVTLDSSN